MSGGLISIISALAGAGIGGFLSFLAAWFVNQKQVRAQWLSHDRERREELYKEFIEDASKCYANALLHEKPDIGALVSLHAEVSRMRVLSTHEVTLKAEKLVGKIMRAYSQPKKTFQEVQSMDFDALDIMRSFSETCREEFMSLRDENFDKPRLRRPRKSPP